MRNSVLTVSECNLNFCPAPLPQFLEMRAEFEALPAAVKDDRREHVSLSDKHGNVMRLIYEWALLGVIEITPEQYEALKDICDRHQALINVLKNPLSYPKQIKNVIEHLTRDIALFRQIVESLPVHSHVMTRQMGDLLADRGVQDLFTFLVFRRLKKMGAPFRILFSNHDEVILRRREADFFSKLLSDADTVFERELGDEETPQDTSLENLSVLIKNKLVSPEEVNDFIDSDYKPALRLIDYERNDAADHIDFFAHSPIDLTAIFHIATVLGVSYRDDTISDICETIDAINQQFAESVRKGELHALLFRGKPDELLTKAVEEERRGAFHEELATKGPGFIFKDRPLFSLIWSRPAVATTDLTSVSDERRKKLCLSQKLYTYQFHYGHVGEEHVVCQEGTRLPDLHYRNLETNIGKTFFMRRGSIKVQYTGFYPSIVPLLDQVTPSSHVSITKPVKPAEDGAQVSITKPVKPAEDGAQVSKSKCSCLPFLSWMGSFFSSKPSTPSREPVADFELPRMSQS